VCIILFNCCVKSQQKFACAAEIATEVKRSYFFALTLYIILFTRCNVAVRHSIISSPSGVLVIPAVSIQWLLALPGFSRNQHAQFRKIAESRGFFNVFARD